MPGNVDNPANIREEDSEPPCLTSRGIEFIERQGDAPWCCRLSHIKPHWPSVAPAPCHAMYGPEDMLPPVRSQDAFINAPPVMKAMMTSQVGRAFPEEATRGTGLRGCMGLIKPCDDQMGGLFDHRKRSWRNDATLIAVTSDHRHFMGDLWLGEKTFFQNAASRGPGAADHLRPLRRGRCHP
ncbi:MAG: hypothetical protein CMP09_21355 [Yangia sp.]|nr:hypothetical protein [Salipiger sp.]